MIEFIQNLSETYKTDLKLGDGEDLPTELEEWSWNYDEQNSEESVTPTPSQAHPNAATTKEEAKSSDDFSIDDLLSSTPTTQVQATAQQHQQQ